MTKNTASGPFAIRINQLPFSATRWQHGFQKCFATFIWWKYYKIANNSNKAEAGEKVRILKVFEHIVNCSKLGCSGTGMYNPIFDITTKEFRLLNSGGWTYTNSKIVNNLDAYTTREYISQVRRLTNTRQKNILLRVWNGDCLSHNRLYKMGWWCGGGG